MLSVLGYATRAALIDAIAGQHPQQGRLPLGAYAQPMPENEALNKLKKSRRKTRCSSR
jgi:glycine dehydrogenase